jgi:hypothetical protein
MYDRYGKEGVKAGAGGKKYYVEYSPLGHNN